MKQEERAEFCWSIGKRPLLRPEGNWEGDADIEKMK